MSPTPDDLVYFPDSRPGIRRRRRGRGWSYIAPDDTTIACRAERARIEALAVPPAYSRVWICPRADGHLQATGYDVRRRKQYRYHARWTAFRAQTKFAHLAAFGAALPAIRRRIAAGLTGDAGERDFALAATLAMIDRLSLRVGDPAYAALNGSHGVTTLRSRHIETDGSEMVVRYTGKGGRKIRKRVKNARLQRALHRLDDLPGQELMTWQDDDGTPHGVRSDMVNDWLHAATGSEAITAKTFRTWNGSTAALSEAVARHAEGARPTIKAMTEAAAGRLCNTATIARTSYVHPEVIALAEDPAPLDRPAPDISGLRRDEGRLLRLLGG